MEKSKSHLTGVSTFAIRTSQRTADTTLTQKLNTDNGLQGRCTRTNGYDTISSTTICLFKNRQNP